LIGYGLEILKSGKIWVHGLRAYIQFPALKKERNLGSKHISLLRKIVSKSVSLSFKLRYINTFITESLCNLNNAGERVHNNT
jgi:hypothetical protein